METSSSQEAKEMKTKERWPRNRILIVITLILKVKPTANEI